VFIAHGIRLSVEFKEKVSSDSGRNDILLRLGVPFCLQYHLVGVVAVMSLPQSQFLDLARVKLEKGKRGRRLLLRLVSNQECMEYANLGVTTPL
jgi:hypothetical protein